MVNVHSQKNKQTPNKGRLFILSAPSGAGKTTLCKILRDQFNDLRYSISYTTRSPREGERAGVDYHFINENRFKQMIDDNHWVEWARVHGHYYGTSAKDIENWLAEGDDVLLDIDVQGASQIMRRYPDSISIFIMPPSKASLQSRLEKRGTDAPDIIQRRLAEADGEMAQRDRYRHVIVNDRLEEAVEKLVEIVKEYPGKRSK